VSATPEQNNVGTLPATTNPTTPGGVAAPAEVPGRSVGDTTKHVLGDIFQTLAGGQKTVWRQTPDGPVQDKVDLKPGEMARGILAAALTGLAGGYDPANRGKGPAMAAAFSGGFKANEQRVEKQEEKQQTEAQQEFKNQGVAQERLLAAHRDAMAQQESIREAQKHDMDMQVAKTNLLRGERLDAEHIADRDAADSTKLIDAKNSGGVPVKDADGKVLEFKSDHDLMQYVQASDANAKRVFGTNQMMNTERLRDPSTGMIYVYQRPIDDHQPRWMGVKTNSDGQPVLDKDGKMQIDKSNPWYGPDGKARVPASKMTPADFNADLRASQQIRGEQLRNQLTSVEINQRNEEYKQLMKNDNAQQLAEQHMAEAGDDYNAIDPKTNKPYVTPEDKNYYMSTTLHMANNASTLLTSLEKEITAKEAADSKDPELPTLRKQASDVTQQLGQYTAQVQSLSKTGTQAIIDYQRQLHGDDLDAVKKDISTLPPGQQKAVLDGLKKPVMPADQRLQNAITNVLDPMSPADRAASIAAFPEKNVGDRNLLYKHYGITPPATTPAPAANVGITAPAGVAALPNILAPASPEEQKATGNFRSGGFIQPQGQGQ
jgi:hypothetical protein